MPLLQPSHLSDPQPPLLLDGGLATHLTATYSHALPPPLWSASLLPRPTTYATVAASHASFFRAGACVATTCSYQAAVPGLCRALGCGEDEAARLIGVSVGLARRGRARVLAEWKGPRRRASLPASAKEAGGGGGGGKEAVPVPAAPPPRLFVAGSIGPYGAALADGSEYTGAYVPFPSDAEFRAHHRGRVAALAAAGADVLALETFPSLAEARAMLGLLGDEFSGAVPASFHSESVAAAAARGASEAAEGAEEEDDEDDSDEERGEARGGKRRRFPHAWLSVTLRDAEHLADGSPLAELGALADEFACGGKGRGRGVLLAVGVNCVSARVALDALRCLRMCTRLPLVCYPNSGEVWRAGGMGGRKEEGGKGDEERIEFSGGGAVREEGRWEDGPEAMVGDDFRLAVKTWVSAGAKVVGGCCRVGTAEIAAMRRALDESCAASSRE